MRSSEELLQYIKVLVEVNTGENLTEVESIVLDECLQGIKKTYRDIALEHDYSFNYIQQVIAPNLWRLLTEVLEEKVSKANIRPVLEKRISFQNENLAEKSEKKIQLELPDGSVPYNSSLYIKRLPEEEACYQELVKPSALLKITAPRQMGKTSLLMRIISRAEELNYKTAVIDVQHIEKVLLSDFDKFLHWFCAYLTLQLRLVPKLDDYWDGNMNNKVSSTLYIEEYLLQQIRTPLVIGIEEINEIFDNLKISQQFFTLIRHWHEKANINPVWQKLRLVMVECTEVNTPLSVDESLSDLGLNLELRPFNQEEVQELIKRHQLHLAPNQLGTVMDLLSGHPYLVRVFLYFLYQQKDNFEQLMSTAATDTGIYSNHLHKHLWNLQDNPELKAAFKVLLNTKEPVKLDPQIALRLKNTGLITVAKGKCTIANGLYRRYFSQRLS
ncbi:MAG: AAA-like domain-containing protein [Gomphosphaeria aponina SAG 52.96 = DSM 107014]|uniref:AAA-like domain-containing protein n=1 Tax=Gomphosphaeria aponina SAG 52.96 = DSM 107014 TaxID=1521640 RepID=A0A941JSS4_9CHRO|nr:AAA-like domain-containing protein [Gomphosphaeria aponina SAG 52.96 = DSM 107014]